MTAGHGYLFYGTLFKILANFFIHRKDRYKPHSAKDEEGFSLQMNVLVRGATIGLFRNKLLGQDKAFLLKLNTYKEFSFPRLYFTCSAHYPQLLDRLG